MRNKQNLTPESTVEESIKMSKRDEKLDFYRGLAILAVVLIHTCFFSGQSYVPEIMRTLCLLYEVPVLVFLAGRSAQYRSDFSSTISALIKIWVEWILISTLVVLGYRLIVGKSAVTALQYLQGLLFYPLDVDILGIFYQSMWYMPMYVVVVLIAGVLQEFDKRVHFSLHSKWSFVLFLVIGLAYTSLYDTNSFFVLNRTQLCFLSFFMIGYLTKADMRFPFRWYLAGMVTFLSLWIGLSRVFGISFLNIQGVKFPPHIIYWSESMLSIVTCCFLWQYGDRLIHRFHFIRFLGKNSLCFFFSQGIGAGLIYRFVPLAQQYGWIRTFLLSLAANYLVTFLLGILFSAILKVFSASVYSEIRYKFQKIIVSQ